MDRLFWLRDSPWIRAEYFAPFCENLIRPDRSAVRSIKVDLIFLAMPERNVSNGTDWNEQLTEIERVWSPHDSNNWLRRVITTVHGETFWYTTKYYYQKKLQVWKFKVKYKIKFKVKYNWIPKDLPLKLRVLLNFILLTWPSLSWEMIRAIDAETKISLKLGSEIFKNSGVFISMSFTWWTTIVHPV